MKFDLPRHDLEVIIVDDSPKLIHVYERFFETAGLKIVAKFHKAEEALAHIASNIQDLAHSVILLDHEMQNMDGVEIARRIRKLNPSQRIIFSTGGDPTKIDIDEKLFDGIVSKPFTISELIMIIEKVASPIRAMGSNIFSDTTEIEDVLSEVLADSNEKLCSVRNPATIGQGLQIEGHVSSYMRARSKGLKVFVVTEITKENLTYCKQLMISLGVELRHLSGVLHNFGVWDEKHLTESIQMPDESYPRGLLLYSNLDSGVSKSQYSFDSLWKLGIPADTKIRELESKSRAIGEIKTISGVQENLRARLDLINNAKLTLDACYDSKIGSNLFSSKLRDA